MGDATKLTAADLEQLDENIRDLYRLAGRRGLVFVADLEGAGDPVHRGGPTVHRARMIQKLTPRPGFFSIAPGGPARRLRSAADYAQLNQAIDRWAPV
jgi:hypothetical protein